MKIPGLPGIGVTDLGNPTRRRFLQMGAATVLPKPPIDISGAGDILDGVRNSSGESFYNAIRKLPVRFFHYEQWLNGGTGELVTFPDEDKPLIRRKISAELEGYVCLLQNVLGKDCELLRYLDFESSFINPEVSSYEANKAQGDINGDYNLLDLFLHFKLPGQDTNEEHYLSIHICPTEDGDHGICHIGNNGIILGRIDHKLGRIIDEFELSIFDEKRIFSILRQPIGELLSDFKIYSCHITHDFDRKNDTESNKGEKSNILSLISSHHLESIQFYDDMVNGRIEITDEVREKVRSIF